MNLDQHYMKLINPEFLGAWDFEPQERKVVTISEIKESEVYSQESKSKVPKLTLVFKEKNVKPMVVSRTNASHIEQATGSPIVKNWVGQQIELYTNNEKHFGKWIDVIRVKPTKPKVAKPALTPQHDAWDKVVAAVAGGYTKAKVLIKYAVSDEYWDLIEAEAEMLNDKNSENHG